MEQKLESKTILLVEDEVIIALNESEILRRNGFNVIHAINGEEALRAMKENPSIDMVLMDINLGRGISGSEAAQQIIRNHTVPVLFLSSHTEPEIVAMTENISSYGYILKNSGETVLLASIRMAFRLYKAHLDLQSSREELEATNEELEAAFEEMQATNEELTRSQLELAELETRYHSLYSSMQEGVAVHQLVYDNGTAVDYIITDVNPRYENLTGISRETVLGKKATSIYGSQEAPYIDVYAKVTESGIPYFFETYYPPMNKHFAISVVALHKNSFATIFSDITEQKIIMHNLNEQKAELEMFFSSSLDLLCITDMEGQFLKLNPQWEKTLGYRIEELVGKHYRDLLHPEDLVKTSQAVAQIQNGETATNLINRYRTSNGTYRWIEWRAYSAENRIYAAAHDITGTVEREQELEKNNRIYAVLGSINEAIVHMDTTESLLQQCCELAVEKGGFLLGWIGLVNNKNQVVPMFWAGNGDDYVPRISINLSQPATTLGPTGQALVRGEISFCNDISTDDRMASWRDAAMAHGYQSSAAFPLVVSDRVRGTFNLYSAQQDFFGKEELILLEKLAHDIAFALELNEKEELRAESEARYRSIFFNNHAPMMVLDPENGRIVDVNPAASEWYGWPVEQMKEMHISEINSQPPEQIQLAMDQANNRQRNHFEFRHNRADGEIRDVEIYSGPIRFEDKQLLYSIIHDITSRKEAEYALENAVKEKEALLAELQHRIKNSLLMITSMVKIETANTSDQTTRSVLDKLHGRIGTLSNLYTMLYSNRESGAIHLDRYLEEIIQSVQTTYFSNDRQIFIVTSLEHFSVDFKKASSVGLIINELLTNAMKYAFSDRAQGKIEVSMINNNNQIEISVRNNGIPLPDNFCFEKSQGMGLLLVSQLTQQLGGHAECFNTDMITFRTIFPLE